MCISINNILNYILLLDVESRMFSAPQQNVAGPNILIFRMLAGPLVVKWSKNKGVTQICGTIVSFSSDPRPTHNKDNRR